MELSCHHFEKLPSTNGWAKEHASTFPKEMLTVVSTDWQTEGYGQFRRPWTSPPSHNIAVSYCFWTEARRPDLIYVALLLAKSASKVLISLGFKPTLKWPNDIMLDGKKVAGTLCETVLFQDEVVAITGIGLNVNTSQPELEGVPCSATSLALASGSAMNREEIFALLTEQFRRDLQILLG